MFTLLIQSTYMHAKSACYLCLSGGPLVDTGIQIEGEGILAICISCVAQMGVVAGVGDPTADAEIEQLSALVENQAKDLSGYKRREASLRQQIKDERRAKEVAVEQREEALERLDGPRSAGPR